MAPRTAAANPDVACYDGRMVVRLSRILVSLPHFVAVAEELHFGRAASRLGMSQPPLSRRIHNLERELGAQLIIRSRQRATLTDAGATFLECATRLLEETQTSVAEVQRRAKGLSGHLRVGFGSSTLYLIPMVVREFARLYPNVELSLHEVRTIMQLDLLRQRKLDVGVVLSFKNEHSLLDERSFRTKSVLKEPLICILPNDHRYAGRATIDLSVLANDGFIMYPKQNVSRMREVVISLCEERGFKPRIVQEANQIATIVALVSAGMGVALIPELAKDLANPGVSCVDLTESVEIEMKVVTLRSPHSSLSEAFIKVASEIGRSIALKR